MDDIIGSAARSGFRYVFTRLLPGGSIPQHPPTTTTHPPLGHPQATDLPMKS